MARARPSKSYLLVATVACLSLLVLLLNFTQFWGIHSLSDTTQRDANPHIDLDTHLRFGLNDIRFMIVGVF